MTYNVLYRSQQPLLPLLRLWRPVGGKVGGRWTPTSEAHCPGPLWQLLSSTSHWTCVLGTRDKAQTPVNPMLNPLLTPLATPFCEEMQGLWSVSSGGQVTSPLLSSGQHRRWQGAHEILNSTQSLLLPLLPWFCLTLSWFSLPLMCLLS